MMCILIDVHQALSKLENTLYLDLTSLTVCRAGSRLLYVLRADAVSPRQQEEPLLPAVAGPRRPLRHPHQLLGRRHARATQVPEGVP